MLDAIDDICARVDRHATADRTVTPLTGLTLFRTEEARPAVNALYRPALCLVAQGRKRVVLGDRIFEYDRNRYLVVTVELPVTGCIVEGSPAHPYLGLTIDLDPAEIGRLLLELPPAMPARATPLGIAVAARDDRLLEPVARLLRLLDRPDDVALIEPLIRKEILIRLLQGSEGALVRQVATAGSHLSQVGQAAEWIRRHYDEPTRVQALAQRVGMSVTSFHRHFKAITQLSPLQYRTRIRLQEARRLMVADEQPVEAIGLRVGYESASQFSREYRQMFGAPPGADASRLRRQVAAPRR